jgi:predicted ferric reductase
MKKAACLTVAAAPVLVVVGAWLWFHTHHPLGNLLTGEMDGQALAWGRLAGLLAVLGVLFQLMLIGRVRWIEQVFGLDRLTRLHHVFGFSLVLLLVLHPVLVTFGHALQADLSYAEQTSDFWKTWRGLSCAMAGLLLMVAALVTSVLVLVKRMPYEVWYATHVTLYAAFALTFLHQVVSGSDLTDHPAFRFYWYALYAFVLLNLLVYRFWRPCALYFKHRFVVERLVPEAHDVTSVYISGRNLSCFRAVAGQFVIVRFLSAGFRWESHPFSISQVSAGSGFRLSIKGVGDFTRRIPTLKPGTPVVVDGPHGVFTSRNCASDKVLLVAGGIGITPICALAEEMVSAGRDVVLLYGNRKAVGVVFRDELDALAARSGGKKIRLVHVLSGDAEWPGEKGHIDRDCLARLVPDLSSREVFLCGPPVMMKGVFCALASLGVPKACVHHERFAL